MPATPSPLPDDPAALKALILAMQETAAKMSATLRAHEALVQALKIQIARLKKQKFGASSEKIEREIEQLELALEHLEIAAAATTEPAAGDEDDATSEGDNAEARTPQRRRKPRVAETTPRERIVLDPGEDCPGCGGALRLVGEDVSEILEFISAKLKVVGNRPPEKVLPTLREDHPDARPVAADSARPGGPKLAGLHPCLEI